MAKRKQKDAGAGNDAAIVDAVCQYMHEHHRSMSIDAVLTRPLDAMFMGAAVADGVGSIGPKEFREIVKLLDRLRDECARPMDALDKICRIALAARKRGDLKRDRY